MSDSSSRSDQPSSSSKWVEPDFNEPIPHITPNDGIPEVIADPEGSNVTESVVPPATATSSQELQVVHHACSSKRVITGSFERIAYEGNVDFAPPCSSTDPHQFTHQVPFNLALPPIEYPKGFNPTGFLPNLQGYVENRIAQAKKEALPRGVRLVICRLHLVLIHHREMGIHNIYLLLKYGVVEVEGRRYYLSKKTNGTKQWFKPLVLFIAYALGLTIPGQGKALDAEEIARHFRPPSKKTEIGKNTIREYNECKPLLSSITSWIERHYWNTDGLLDPNQSVQQLLTQLHEAYESEGPREHYVYFLLDPREAHPLRKIFYIGKGKGDRLERHETLTGEPRYDRMDEIGLSGHAHFSTRFLVGLHNNVALAVEGILIRAVRSVNPKLTNGNDGHGFDLTTGGDPQAIVQALIQLAIQFITSVFNRLENPQN